MEDIGGAENAGGQGPAPLLDERRQPIHQRPGRFIQAHIQRQGVGGLGVAAEDAVRQKTADIGVLDVLIQPPVTAGILLTVQNRRGLGHQGGRIGVIGRGHQRLVCGTLVAALRGIQRDPVAKLSSGIPDIVSLAAAVPDETQPFAHAVILFPEDGGIAVHQVALPGHDDGGVSPARGAGVAPQSLLMFQNVGHLMGDAAAVQLFRRQIPQPFPIEGEAVISIHRRAAEQLGVPRPAAALVPLGAVGGYIQ